MVQTVVIFALFAAAIFYLGRLLFKAFRPAKHGCAGDCKCDSKVQVTPRP